MSQLARSILRLLKAHLRATRSPLTYKDLVRALRLANPNSPISNPRDPRLGAALGEIVDDCRAKGLPAIPAIVWNAKLRRPGVSYYPRAHRYAKSLHAQRHAWRREYAQVLSCTSF